MDDAPAAGEPLALVTSSRMPKADTETGLLVDALAALGQPADVVAWDAPDDWSRRPLVVLRTPWDYVEHLDAFLAWATGVDQQTTLLNPLRVVRWNSHKRYLLDLQRHGVAVVPTTLVQASWRETGLGALLPAGELVVKPAVGSGARGALRGRSDEGRVLLHIQDMLRTGDALVQPFVPDIATAGEVSLVFFDGVFSHAVRKLPASGDYRVQDEHGGRVEPHRPTTAELQLALDALALSPGKPTYARVDLVTWGDAPAVMELELIEPELFLAHAPSAPSAFARVLRRALAPSPPVPR